MNKRLAWVLGLAFISASASSSDAADHFMTLGVGTKSCGAWTDAREYDHHSENIYSAWIEGYITAFNEFKWPSGDVSSGTDFDGIEAWMDNYCSSHPLDDLAAAAGGLVVDLAQKNSTTTRPPKR